MKKYFFVAFITFCLIISCNSTKHNLQHINTKNINITTAWQEEKTIDSFIAPYRKHVEEKMSAVLAYNPSDLFKEKASLNMEIGNFMADASLEQVDPVFFNRTGKHIDLVLLNWGGIRSDLSKGNITTRSAYDIMPFENKLLVLELKGNRLLEMANYLAKGRKGHPLSKGIELGITRDGKVENFTLNGKAIDPNNTYYVGTTDYLMNGGDGMTFLSNPDTVFEMDYLLRNILIDYFTKIDTLKTKKDNRFIFVD